MAKSLKDKFIKEFATSAQVLVEGQKLMPTPDVTPRAASILMKKFLLPDTMDFEEAKAHPMTKMLVEVVEEFAKGEPATDAQSATRAIMAYKQCEAAWVIFKEMTSSE